MPRRLTSLLILIAACAAIAGTWLDGPWLWLHYIGKPLTTLLILWLALSAQPAVDARYRRAVLAGLVLSLIGDVFLMLPGDRFVLGLVAFLLAHVCYIVAFAPGSSAKARALAFVVVAAIAARRARGRPQSHRRCRAARAWPRSARCSLWSATACWPGIVSVAVCRCRRCWCCPVIGWRSGASRDRCSGADLQAFPGICPVVRRFGVH